MQHQVCTVHVLRNTEGLRERYQPMVACDADGLITAIVISAEEAAANASSLRRTSQEPTT